MILVLKILIIYFIEIYNLILLFIFFLIELDLIVV